MELFHLNIITRSELSPQLGTIEFGNVLNLQKIFAQFYSGATVNNDKSKVKILTDNFISSNSTIGEKYEFFIEM